MGATPIQPLFITTVIGSAFCSILLFCTNVYKDCQTYIFGKVNTINVNDKSYKIPSNFRVNMEIYLNKFNDLRKYFFKKYIYTINHKRIALNYLYFSM
jgi:hypothetical protein